MLAVAVDACVKFTCEVRDRSIHQIIIRYKFRLFSFPPVCVDMTKNNYGSVWQRLDNQGEVSSLVMTAYGVSFLLLASVLLWTHVGEAWMQFAYSSSLDGVYNNFTVLHFAW